MLPLLLAIATAADQPLCDMAEVRRAIATLPAAAQETCSALVRATISRGAAVGLELECDCLDGVPPSLAARYNCFLAASSVRLRPCPSLQS